MLAATETNHKTPFTILVAGSRGAEYTIARGPHGYSCTCPAYRFTPARPCKHIRSIAPVGGAA